MIKVDETDPVGELEPCFPYRDVTFRRNVDIKEWYELQTEIGRGKFGTVYRCKERGTGLSLAAKYVATPRREDRRNVEREVDIMRVLQHPRLIQLYDAFDNGKTMCLVLELIEGGELFERVIDDDFVLTERACAVFMRQICEGIDFIHKQNILHLDMKPENILCLTRTGNRIKIIDFGLARKFDPDKKLQVLFGTPEFVAPEVVNFDQIGFGTDMWSVGVICYVLLSGLSPFMGDTDIETMANVTIAKYDFDDEAFDEISTEAKDFIQRLLLKDQSARFTAAQCVAHPWLRRRPPPAPAALPPAPVVPVVVEAPSEPPSPQPLEVTKDNLRGFVERWSEHPNSPYLFDLTCHSISLTSMSLAHQASQQSMRMCTPSPRGSLPSSPDSVIELDNTEEFEHYSFQDQPSTHGRFLERLNKERRASDSSCLPNHAPIQQVSPVNLAEEIRRLSDRLIRMVKEIPTDIVNNNSNNERNQKFRVSDVNSRDVPLSMIQKNQFPPPSSPCTLRSLSSSSGTSQSLPSSPTCRLSPEPTPPSTRELVLHLQQESSSMHKQQVNSQHCTMRWGQIEISMEHMSQTTIKSMKSIFESSSSEYTSSSSKSNNINKKDSQSKAARVPLKLA